MELLKPQEAARLAGVSYQTLKKWIYEGKLHSITTAGGHHRIPQRELDRVIGAKKRRARKTPLELASISGRNKLLGTVTEVRYSGLLAQVAIEIEGQTITSIITSDAARELDLKRGMAVYALVKATEVMIVRG